jgi:tetratricopeptide (TPR) repeat protein
MCRCGIGADFTVAKPDTGKSVSALARRLRGLSPHAANLLRDIDLRLQRGDLDGAERALIAVVVLAPDHAETLRLQGLAEHRRGRHAQAAAIYAQALAGDPDNAAVLSQSGELAADMGDMDNAFARLRRATDLAPQQAELWFRLGTVLDRQAHNEEALEVAHRVFALDPKHRLVRILLARNLHALGRIDEAAAQYRKLVAEGGPRAYQAWFSLVDLKTVRIDAAEIAALERLARDPQLGVDARATLDFALGKVHEDAGRHADAFHALARANSARRGRLQWNAAGFSREIDGIQATFAAPLDETSGQEGSEVIFVLGMPRSGTTLIEQILAAHPEVEGASELPDLPAVISAESKRLGQPFPAWTRTATADDWQRLGRDYLARTARWRVQRPRSTDKLPNNWPLVGAIARMLPGAKIIDCRRDPVETCWSCYKQLFAPGLVAYAYELGELAAYWRDYDRLCRFWAEQYPQRFRAQGYEALQAHPEEQIRELLAFCGLPFNEKCLRFHEAPRGVRTVSAGQVRQPLRRDTARTAAYGDLLAPLRDALRAG